jgi:hypothetical protein
MGGGRGFEGTQGWKGTVTDFESFDAGFGNLPAEEAGEVCFQVTFGSVAELLKKGRRHPGTAHKLRRQASRV